MWWTPSPCARRRRNRRNTGIWWSASTLLTVGYGDIYPITTMGKFLGIAITFLGVGMVAIPTGIISAGFVEQYTRLKRIGDKGIQEDIKFIQLKLGSKDAWVGRKVRDIGLPQGVTIAVIQRGRETIIPKGNVELKPGDKLVIGAEALKNDTPVDLKEIVIHREHEWHGEAVRDLDISRQTYLVMIRRNGRSIVPNGNTMLKTGDSVILYTQKKAAGPEEPEDQE